MAGSAGSCIDRFELGVHLLVPWHGVQKKNINIFLCETKFGVIIILRMFNMNY